MANATMRVAFKFWAGAWRKVHWNATSGFVSKNLARSVRDAHLDLKNAFKAVKSTVRLEKLAAVDRQKEQIHNAVVNGFIPAINESIISSIVVSFGSAFDICIGFGAGCCVICVILGERGIASSGKCG